MNDADREERERVRKLPRDERLARLREMLAEAERRQREPVYQKTPVGANLPRMRFET
jgi:hypothetical protein